MPIYLRGLGVNPIGLYPNMYRYFHFDLSYTYIPQGATVSTPPTPCRPPWACLLSINQYLYIYIYTSISTYSFTYISISPYL